ncbi:MAG: hypothetical protein KTR13_06135 [Saprospiraceae bacterium]|nr:hypothetical protein [Saprospiraceae bacterium]
MKDLNVKIEGQKVNVELIWSALKSFFKSSWISLLIVIAYVGILINMEQGSIVVVDLLERPFNLFLFLAIIHLLSLVVSLYPVYLTKWRESETISKDTNWTMHHPIFGLGIILYKYQPQGAISPRKKILDRLESIFRKFLGVFFYLGILYTLFFVSKKYFGQPHSAFFWIISAGLTGLYIWLIFVDRDKYVQKAGNILFVLFWASSLIGLASIFASIKWGWHPITLGLVAGRIFLTGIEFILFRKFRKKLTKENGIKVPHRWFSNDLNYVTLTAVGGWMGLVIFFLAQLNIYAFNPAVIILSFFYTFYGVFIIPIKHYFFYKRNPDAKRKKLHHFVFTQLIFIAFPLIVALNMSTAVIGNNLHELDIIKELPPSEIIDEAEYLNAFQDHFADKDQLFFIASYGGGLRANAWTQLVLEELSEYPITDTSSVNILESTAAMSGVSGGALGLAFYTSLIYEEYTPEQRDSLIQEMGAMNALSLDVAWTFGADYIRELKPWKVFNDDRAKRIMKEYEKKVSDGTFMSDDSFRKYWAKTFQKKRDTGQFYPALLLNSSSYNEKRGIASSIDFGSDFNSVFPDAIDVLSIKDGHTLSYLHGTSPSHRFPVFSPGADIPGKGIFLDGGYFENSGMMSILDFYDYLTRKLPDFMAKKDVIFIQINNGKQSYARNTLEIFKDSVDVEVKDMGELTSMIKTVLSTSMVSNYFEKQLEQDSTVSYVGIDLPFTISKKAAKDMFFTQELDTAIVHRIDTKNAALDSILFIENARWEVAEPAMGRLITEKAVNYMQSVIQHDKYLFEDLDSVINNRSFQHLH